MRNEKLHNISLCKTSFEYFQLFRILFEKHFVSIFDFQSFIHSIHLIVFAKQYECVEMIVNHYCDHNETSFTFMLRVIC